MGVFRLAWCLIGPSMADDKELQRLFRWVMTWPQGKRGVSKMSDFDLALDPSCDQQSGVVDWRAVQRHVRESIVASEAVEENLQVWNRDGRLSGSVPSWGQCRPPVQQAVEVLGAIWELDVRYSSWRSDCYLGWLSVHLSDVLCSLHGAVVDDEDSRLKWYQKWTKTQLELEGLFFYVDLPWHVLLAARWPIAQLMALLGRALLMLVGEAVPNRCDEVG